MTSLEHRSAVAGSTQLRALVTLAVALVAAALGLSCNQAGESTVPSGGVIILQEPTQTTMRALDVAPPQEPRWRDIAGAAYSDDFRASFDYADTAAHRVEVHYQPQAPTLTGTITATGLKPWFAYQLKLVGQGGILGADEGANAGDAAAWSSWQLGRTGRWWCEHCHWNVSDADLAQHVACGHTVRGYLLFDWLVTDAAGNATRDFALDSSLHVLWRVGQRERAPDDGPPRWYRIERGKYAYPPALAGTVADAGMFAEWEPDRPAIGRVRLFPGEYRVLLNVTEESFHDNMDDERVLAGGGFWAWVLEADLAFDVRPAVSRAGCPGCIPGPSADRTALWRQNPGRSGG